MSVLPRFTPGPAVIISSIGRPFRRGRQSLGGDGPNLGGRPFDARRSSRSPAWWSQIPLLYFNLVTNTIAVGAALDLAQRLRNVGNEIGRMLDADRQPDR